MNNFCWFSHDLPPRVIKAKKRPAPQAKVIVQKRKVESLPVKKSVPIYHEMSFHNNPDLPPPKKIMIVDDVPMLLPDLESRVDKVSRQKILTKVYHEFKRIYAPLKDGELIHEHSIAQELAIYNKSTPKSYMIMATASLRRLKARPPSQGKEDVGIDGEWVAPKPEEQLDDATYESLKTLILTSEDWEKMQYPCLEFKEETFEESDKQVCDRCNNEYNLTLNPPDACLYHYGNIIAAPKLEKNIGVYRIYSCCRAEFGSPGCCEGPHVFKETDDVKLNARIPFRYLAGVGSERVVALDCEMSYTMGGMELTRVSFVNWVGKTILDELVKTKYPIVDYNTRFSGISSLESATLTMDTLFEKITKMLHPDVIFIGHGLENDLRALRILHRNVVDTAQLYPHPKGLPFRRSLRMLCHTELDRRIQTSSTQGHDSVQDSVACIDLVKKYQKDNKL